MSVAAMVGVGDASTIRSASWASWSRDRAPAEGVNTIRTFDGRRWRKSSRSKVGSTVSAMPPNSCWMCRKTCEGVLSPSSSSAERNSFIRRCSEAVVRLVNSAFRTSYGVSAGGCRRRSLTSVANSGDNDATMWSNFVFDTVMPRVENCDSICANHSSGSFGQNGGNLSCTAAT